MKIIQMRVRNKIARLVDPYAYIVAHNSDYVIEFSFDEEWDGQDHALRTARFVTPTTTKEIVFSGNVCPIPDLPGDTYVNVGVYAGDIYTTSPCRVSIVTAILDKGNNSHGAPTESEYQQIINLIQAGMLKGKSAYDIAVDNGYTGTEKEWLESLHGSNGTMQHEELENRNLPNQHTIEAITGLREELNEKQNQIYLSVVDGKICITYNTD